MLLLPQAFEERKSVQKSRRRSDKEIETMLGKEPLDVIQEYFASLSRQALRKAGAEA